MRPRATRALQLTLRPSVRSLSTTAPRYRPEEHDIVVVGGGPAGLALAAALASSESISSTHKITLLEGSQLDKVKSWSPPVNEYSNRVSSITADNVAYLSSIGVWPHLDLSRTRGVEEMQVWDGISSARITFSSPSPTPDPFSPLPAAVYAAQISPMATLTENLNLQRGALRYLETTKVETIDGKRVAGIERDETGWPVVKLEAAAGEESRSLRARLLIGADGANSPVKSYSKIDTFGWAYDVHGIVASLEVSAEERGVGMTTAWQRFLPEGPIAFLPLSDTSASLVWSTTPALAAAIKKLPIELLPSLINAAYSLPYPALSSFLNHLLTTPAPSHLDLATALSSLLSSQRSAAWDPNQEAEELPPAVTRVQPGTVASFPLRLSHTSSYLGLPSEGRDARTVLVGDAAHTIHPLAGQGLNMGLGDVQSLVKTLETTIENGGDVGQYTNLRAYPRARYIPNHAILSTCDHLSTLYSTTLAPVVWARSTGLETLNEIDSLKNLIMGGAGSGVGVKTGRGEGAWGVVADGVEKVRNGVELAKAVGGLVGAQLKNRLEYLVKR